MWFSKQLSNGPVYLHSTSTVLKDPDSDVTENESQFLFN